MTVIAILAGLLLPALTRAKEAGRAAACSSNLRQLAIASATYALDNKGRLPYFLEWLYTRQGDLTSGRLFPYLKNKPVYLCPTDKNRLATNQRMPAGPTAPIMGSTMYPRDYSYAMNCGLCHESDPAKFLLPTHTLVFMRRIWPRTITPVRSAQRSLRGRSRHATTIAATFCLAICTSNASIPAKLTDSNAVRLFGSRPPI